MNSKASDWVLDHCVAALSEISGARGSGPCELPERPPADDTAQKPWGSSLPSDITSVYTTTSAKTILWAGVPKGKGKG